MTGNLLKRSNEIRDSRFPGLSEEFIIDEVKELRKRRSQKRLNECEKLLISDIITTKRKTVYLMKPAMRELAATPNRTASQHEQSVVAMIDCLAESGYDFSHTGDTANSYVEPSQAATALGDFVANIRKQRERIVSVNLLESMYAAFKRKNSLL